MSKVLNTLSAIGALVMAATPLVAVGGIAHAEPARAVHVKVGDLNLARPGDAAIFRQRVDTAADTFCSTSDFSLSAVNNCRHAVRQEAVERLGDQQRQDRRAADAASRVTWAMAAR